MTLASVSGGRTRLKVCCVASRHEAAVAIAHGADALGLVSAMPSGPGVIEDATIAAVAACVPPPIATFLLTSRTDAAAITAQARAAGVTTVQLVDAVAVEEIWALRRELPYLRVVQVIHVLDPASVAEARAALPHVHALLLDSGNPRLTVKELGGTGRVHDWALSREIRDAADAAGVPVFLAGGLRAENVADAVRAVCPFGVDVCSGVRVAGRLDPARLAAFARALAAADETLSCVSGNSGDALTYDCRPERREGPTVLGGGPGDTRTGRPHTRATHLGE